jgi:hypothetical protein
MADEVGSLFCCCMILGILWSEMTLNYRMMVERYPNLKKEEKRLAIRFMAVKSHLYMTENLQGGQLPPMLRCWHAGLLSQKRKEKKIVGMFQTVE